MPYVFQEYPKWVHRAGSKPVLVQDADEEAALAPVVAVLKSTNMLVGEGLKAGDHLTANQPVFNGQTEAVVSAVAPSDAPRRGGWPKGKKRNTSRVSVN